MAVVPIAQVSTPKMANQTRGPLVRDPGWRVQSGCVGQACGPGFQTVVGYRRRFDRFLDTLTAVTIMKR